jgi:ubiquinone/menaquinone biosynthesis C-methylase UbiE
MPAHYDDPNYLYTEYWQDRNYEHQSEILAIKKLLAGSHFHTSVDIGGGYGRLIPTLSPYSNKIILIEPSNKLRSIAKKQLSPKKLTILPGTAQHTHLPSSSVNLISLIRVMHHIPDPTSALTELSRILKPSGQIILEFANSYNFKARIASLISGNPILPIPIEKRSQTNIKRQTIPFVNHHPQTILKLLQRAGFKVRTKLSVSNFRSPFLKRIVPLPLLLALEKNLQTPLGNFYFGPSIFLLLDKQTNP